MTRLRDLANAIRSTNNGGTWRTFDIMFDEERGFRHVWNSRVIYRSLISKLYSVPEDAVRIFDFPPANAIKITIPRNVVAGTPADTNIDGKQQHVPLLTIEIPD